MAHARVGLLALLLLGVVLFAGYRTLAGGEREIAISRSCEAVQAGRWDQALALDADLVAADAQGRKAAECLCWALLASQRRDACVPLLERAMGDPAEGEAGTLRQPEWLPDPLLAKLLIRAWRDAGRAVEAAALARGAAHAYPDDVDLVQLEVMARTAVEEAHVLFAELEERLAARPQDWPLALVVSTAYARRGDHHNALRSLGSNPPPRDHPHLALWFEKRIEAQAALNQPLAVRQSFASWAALGGEPAELQARHALVSSTAQLRDPEQRSVELLRSALDRRAEIADDELVAGLYYRLVAHLIADGDLAGALTTYDEAAERITWEALTREEVERRIRLAALAPAERASALGTLVFQIPDRPVAQGALLRVSPGPSSPPDADYELHTVQPGERVRVERATSATPYRWVLQGTDARILASGSSWSEAGRESEVAVALVAAPTTLPKGFAPSAQRAPADGRRRVFSVILDCADWRITQYLRTRGELPVHDYLFANGFRAVLSSRPALTAAAMEKLVWPTRGRQISFVGLVHKMGLELGGLASVGENPLEFLSQLLPEGDNIFEQIGAGDRVAANMLFSHGGIDAARNAEMVGPHGERRLAQSPHAYRALAADELRYFSDIDAHPRVRGHLQTIAAEFDASIELAHADEVDLLLIRIEPLDLLTHLLFREITVTHQDDGRPTLFGVYRYIDERLGQLYDKLDADDVLIVMSDHGIRTAMEHEEDALFIAVGAGVPAGRAAGAPGLQGVARAIADLMGVETAWPDTGVAPWATAGAAIASAPPPEF